MSGKDRPTPKQAAADKAKWDKEKAAAIAGRPVTSSPRPRVLAQPPATGGQGMVEVFIEITGQNGQRTMIPGGPFANRQAAYAALNGYATQHYGSYFNLIQAIDAYGFIVQGQGGGTIRTQTKP
jgi:hypothetical protein